MSNDKPLLEVQHVSKSFPGVHALKDLTLDVTPGEVHALVGENGAGKSTFLKILGGDQSPDSGTILFKGLDLTRSGGRHFNYNTHVARRLGIAMVYQQPALVPDLSVAENIFLGRYSYKPGGTQIDWKDTRRRARDLVDQYGIDLDVTSKIKTLGAGQQQLVEILRAVSRKVKLLLLDEPTSALSSEQVDILFNDVLGRMLKENVSIVYISHRLEEVFRIAGRVTVLRDGAKVATERIEDVDENEVIRMMVGRRIEEYYVKHPVPIAEPLLRVEGLRAHGLIADCSFEVRKGEILGVAGLVGAGRTEMAKAIVGLHRKDQGKIIVEGEEKRIDSPRDALTAGLVYLAENRTESLVHCLDIAKNITLARLKEVFRAGLMLNRNKESAIAEDFVNRMHIEATGVGQVVRQLSGGNQQKVALSRLIYCDAKVFILDEPTRGIDVGAKVEVYNLMYRLLRDGKAIVLISSELPEIVSLSDRVIVAYKGRIVAEYAGQEISQENIIQSATGRRSTHGHSVSAT